MRVQGRRAAKSGSGLCSTPAARHPCRHEVGAIHGQQTHALEVDLVANWQQDHGGSIRGVSGWAGHPLGKSGANVNRRSLTVGQKAMIRLMSGARPEQVQTETSRTSRQRAEMVRDFAPDLIADVVSGASLETAWRTASERRQKREARISKIADLKGDYAKWTYGDAALEIAPMEDNGFNQFSKQEGNPCGTPSDNLRAFAAEIDVAWVVGAGLDHAVGISKVRSVGRRSPSLP